MNLPFETETDVERAICADVSWQTGAFWGLPRSGHPEGTVAAHVAMVLANVDKNAVSPEDRARLRLCAIIHDSFKYKVDKTKPKEGPNHHGHIAARFAEKYTQDKGLVLVIETHDDAYNAWKQIERGREWNAVKRAGALILRLGDEIPFYLRFYRSDNGVPGKTREPVEWFERFLKARGFAT